MTVDADLTIKILEKIQTDLQDLKTDMQEVKGQLEYQNARVGAVELRLGTVDRLLVTLVDEVRAVTQVVKQHGHRLDLLEQP